MKCWLEDSSGKRLTEAIEVSDPDAEIIFPPMSIDHCVATDVALQVETDDDFDFGGLRLRVSATVLVPLT